MLHFEPYRQRKKFLHALARRVCLKEFYGDVYVLHSKQKLGKEKTDPLLTALSIPYIVIPIESIEVSQMLHQQDRGRKSVLTSAKVRKVFETAKFQLLQNIVKK